MNRLTEYKQRFHELARAGRMSIIALTLSYVVGVAFARLFLVDDNKLDLFFIIQLVISILFIAIAIWNIPKLIRERREDREAYEASLAELVSLWGKYQNQDEDE